MLQTSNGTHMSSSRLRRAKTFPSRHNREGGGRLSDKPITEALLAILNSGLTNHLRGRTVADLVAISLVRQAIEGNIQAIKEILDRTEGRVPQARVEEPGDREVKVNIEYVGGKDALDRPRLEFEEANRKDQNYKTN